MLAKFSVKKPFTILVAVVLIVVLGIVSVGNMTPDLLPDMSFPYVMIYTIYAGASPEEVETIVTKPLEQAMATLSNVKQISSTSGENYSVVSMEFTNDVNMDAITIDIREGINSVSAAWDDYVVTPTILKLSPNMIPTTVAAVHFEGMDTIELSNFVTDTLAMELEGTDGVAAIAKTGLLTQTLDVTIDDAKLDAMNEKIFTAIDEQFEEATVELDEAKQQLQDGQKEIEENTERLQEGEREINAGRNQAGREFANAQATLDATQAELTQLETDLTAQRGELVATLDTLISAQQQLIRLQGAIYALETAQELFNSSIRLIEQNDNLSEEQKAQYIAEIKNSEEYQTVYNGLADIDAQLADLSLSRGQVGEKIIELVNTRPQLEDGIEQIDEALAQLQEGKLELENGYTLLDEQKQEVYGQLNAAQSQIRQGYAALDAAKEQMEAGEEQLTEAEKLAQEQLQTAYDAANLHNVLTRDMVSSILAAQNFSMPAGYVQSDDGQWLVQVGDKFSSVDGLDSMVLFSTGLDGVDTILLGDIANVELKDNAGTTFAKINGADGVLLSFTKQSTYASAQVARNIQDAMAELEKTYPGLSFTRLFDQGDYINMAVGTVVENLVVGGILAMLILLLFLWDIRPTFIVACSIPISVMFALVLMYFSGVTINLISMAGLAVGIGMLVDNSIVVIENIYRLRSLGVPVKEAAITGAKQVTGAITASTLTTICVFAPIIFVQGITRQLFSDMALTITYSLLASLIVAITLIPAMVRGLLRREVKPQKDRTKRLLDKYEKVVRFCMGHRILCIALAIVLLGGSMFFTLRKGFSYMPQSGGTQISIEASLPDDTNFEDASALANEMLNRMYAIDGLSDVGGILSSGGITSLIGLTGSSSDEPESITIYALIDEKSGASSAKMSATIKEAMADLESRADIVIAGMSTMDASSMMGGEGVVVNVYGTELDAMNITAQRVVQALQNVEGIDKVDDGMAQTSNALHIEVDKNAAMEHNLTTSQVYLALSSRLSASSTATQVLTEDGTLNIRVISGKDAQLEKADIYNMSIAATGMDGSKEEVALKDIAKFSETTSLQSIARINQRRYISVSATIQDGYNVTLVSQAAQEAVNAIETESGANCVFEGESESIMSSLSDLLFMLALGVLLIYLIMVAQFQSLLSPFIVMFTVPLAFTGGFLALWVSGLDVSIVSMIGFIMLIGVVVNNGIVLVDCINQLRAGGMEKKDAIVAAERMRLRPVLMTALTTILGLLPLALGIGTGAEIVQPVAIVCIGGLTYATLTTLLIVPIMYDVFTRNKKKQIKE